MAKVPDEGGIGGYDWDTAIEALNRITKDQKETMKKQASPKRAQSERGRKANARRVVNDHNALKLQEIAMVLIARRTDSDRRSDSELFAEIERIVKGEP